MGIVKILSCGACRVATLRPRRLAAGTVAAFCSYPAQKALAQYRLTDLGALPAGHSSEAVGINASGQVVGWSSSSTSLGEASLYSNGTIQDLGTLGGTASYASGINDSGQVVGGASASSSADHAFLYSNGTMQDLAAACGRRQLGLWHR